jgi:hypothetical protein
MYPKRSLERLENHLVEVELDETRLLRKLDQFYEGQQVESPGVTPDDFKKTILEAKG